MVRRDWARRDTSVIYRKKKTTEEIKKEKESRESET